MDKIILNNLRFFIKKNPITDEKKISSDIVMNIELQLSLTAAAKSDDLANTINYESIYVLISEHIEKNSYNLLESLIQGIMDDIEKIYDKQINKIIICIKKYALSFCDVLGNVEVQMERII